MESPANNTKWDLLVAKDGSGNFTTIGEAVAAARNSSETRFVIYIRAERITKMWRWGERRPCSCSSETALGKPW
ncbi:Pectinesterase [Bertholletia excelsa]